MPRFQLMHQSQKVWVEAERFDGSAASAMKVMDMIGTRGVLNSPEGLYIFRADAEMKAEKGDWIIRGPKGDLSLCEPGHFEATYKPA